MENKRLFWIDFLKGVCCIWIVTVWHANNYLFEKYDFGICGNLITKTSLSLFFIFSGVFAIGGGISTTFSESDVKYFLKKKFIRLYPLFFMSLTSFFLASFVFESDYRISISKYILTLIGIAWMSPPQVATLWFASILWFFIICTAIWMMLPKIWHRVGGIMLSYVLICVFSRYHNVDERIIMYYPMFFAGVCFSDKVKSINVLFRPEGVVWKMINIIAYSSYCMYLFHRQIYEIFERLVGKFMVWQAVIYGIIVIIVSYVVQKMYDNLIMKLNKLQRIGQIQKKYTCR